MAARNRFEVNVAFRGGVAAGLVAGLVMALVMVVLSIVNGTDVWMVLKTAALPVVGDRAAAPGFDAPVVMVALLLHFAVAIGFAVLFGIAFFGLSRGATMIAGVLFGAAVWGIMYGLVMPGLGLSDLAHGVPAGTAIAEHLLYGLVVAATFLPFQRERLYEDLGRTA